MIHEKYYALKVKQERLLERRNLQNIDFYNGVFTRYAYPVLTAEHVPVEWRYDLDRETNPYFIERLGINAVFNAGAIYHEGRFWLMPRVEANDRKSFFALASSTSGIDNFRFVDRPVVWDDPDPKETNVYDIRLTKHEDGYIYGLYCSESKDPEAETSDTTSAVANIGILRTKDLKHFEKLPNLVTPASQQRNVALHPEFVQGKYLLYTRPQDGFISTGSGGGIACGFVDDMINPVINEEKIIDQRIYHTNYELKNGVGPAPIKTEKGWIHFAHGVRNTASGLRYVLYLFVTSLDDPSIVVARPSGYLLAPMGSERTGDVNNVLFANGVIVDAKGTVYLYYGSSDTRLHVATSSISILLDYAFNSPQEVYHSRDAICERRKLIEKNASIVNEINSGTSTRQRKEKA